MKHPTEHPDAYHYAECGLPNVWLVNGFERKSTPYGEGVTIHDMIGLHKCISRIHCDKPEPLTGQEFKFLRRELDLSQQMLGEIFGIQPRQVRNIEQSEQIKNPYDTFIRHMYLESVDPESSLIPLFERLRIIDVEWHQNLSLKFDGHGWKMVPSRAA